MGEPISKNVLRLDPQWTNCVRGVRSAVCREVATSSIRTLSLVMAWLPVHTFGMREATSLTDLIRRAGGGDNAAFKQMFDATYDELRRLAHSRLTNSSRGAFLNTTALVHESYLRFASVGRLQINDRQHFLRYASNVMRSVIVDLVREGGAQRRGGDIQHVTLDTEAGDSLPVDGTEILRVHEALEALAQCDARMATIVEMRYFAGMSEAEIAEILNISVRTVRRSWEKARLWLAAAMQ